MDIERLQALVELVARTGIAELELTEGQDTIRILGGHIKQEREAAPRIPAAPVVRKAAPPKQPDAAAKVVEAPMHGVFHAAPAPGEPPFVQPGQKIEAGQKVGIIEAMKVFNTITALEAGEIAAILVANGEEVEMGQPLMRLA